MAYVPYSQQIDAFYTITGPNGVVAVLNDASSGNFVGQVTEISGLDSSSVRDAGDDLVQADGGYQGDSWYGRRTITFKVSVYGHATALARDTKIDKLTRALDAMRGDAILAWTNQPSASYLAMQTWVRRQDRIQVTGGWNKEVQFAVISPYAFLFGQALKSQTGSPTNCENQGSAKTYPIVRVTGAVVNPVVTIAGVGTLNTTGLTIGAGQYVDFDLQNHTATWDSGASANRYIDYSATTWPYLPPAATTAVSTSGGTLTVTWRDAWV